jgi:nucleoside-diphosphate-sugar epimerase
LHRAQIREKLRTRIPPDTLHPETPHLLLCGHGYLGRAVAQTFRTHNWHITCLSLSGGHDSLACDLGNADAVARIAAEIKTPDAIVHCAASGRGGPDAYRHVYLSGMRNLAGLFPGTPLLFTSSTSVYAQTDGSVVTEESPAEPDRETGRILLASERITLDAGGTIARIAGIYGPGRSVLLQKFLGGTAILEEDGNRYINQIHRDDAAPAIYHLVASRGGGIPGIFNVSDSQPITQADCYAGLASIFGLPLPPTGARDPMRKRGWTHKRVSSAKLVATGWTPSYPRFLDVAKEIATTL